MGFVRHSILFDAHVTQKPKAMILVVLFVLSFYSTYGISNLQSQSTSLLETPIAQSSHVDLNDIVLTRNVSMTPINIDIDPSTQNSASLGLGELHSCMIASDTSLHCWGNNGGGRLGLGNNTNNENSPLPVTWQDGSSGATARLIAAGGNHGCAVLSSATESFACWGRNSAGQLGVGNTTNAGEWRYFPNNVTIGNTSTTQISEISLGNEWTCVISNNDVYCWGSNSDGQIGQGSSGGSVTTPTLLNLGPNVDAVRIELGQNHACAISSDGDVYCWGKNNAGQVNGGDPNTNDVTSPSKILSADTNSGDEWADIALGDSHSCALSTNNSIFCWGKNDQGQLGFGNISASSAIIWEPDNVSEQWDLSIAHPIAIDAGLEHTCALLDNGSVFCWGNNGKGELGRGQINTSPSNSLATPEAVSFPQGTVISELNIGGRHNCAVDVSDNLYCWGHNNHGQLGLGNTSVVGEPSPILVNIPIETEWEIYPSLPQGLTLNNTTGVLSGNPSSVLSKTEYTVYANSTVERSRSINITILEQPPVISYNSTQYELILNLGDNLPITPSSTGGNVTSWAISDTLPLGLNFSNGIINGTPQVLQLTPLNYTIWANNTGGSDTWNLSIRVVDQPMNLTYNPQHMYLTKDIQMNPNQPTITGGSPGTFEIEPSLPSNLQFDSTNATISGTPTIEQSTTNYTVWANNSGGNESVIVSITIVDQLPTVSYNITILECIKNTSQNLPFSPVISGGGTITSWQINRSLPTGLDLNSSTGAIEGIPTQLTPITQFKIWANNSNGSIELLLNLSVVDQLPNINYNPNNVILTINNSHSDFPLPPTITGTGEIISWEISGILPTGVEFNQSTGIFSGIATELFSETTYTIWANNSGGSRSTSFTLRVIDEAPSIEYPSSALILINNTQSTDLPFEPVISGNGSIDTWEINATLPEGLNFGVNNGTIWGTPTELWNQTAYMVWANNTGGSAIAYLNITVVDQFPDVWYNFTSIMLVVDQNSQLLPLTPQTNDVGKITSWTIQPSLPEGLDFSNQNGTISGIPTELLETTNFTVRASNTGGYVNIFIEITVVDQTPLIQYVPDEIILTVNQTSLYLEPQIIGQGNPTSWSIIPPLPNGLNMVNGTISGMSSEVLIRTTFTILASNSGGQVSTTLNITVNDLPVIFNYNLTILEMVINQNHPFLPLSPNIQNSGSPDSWEIYPNLPQGLYFSSENGVISGIPEVIQEIPITYKIWANNSGGPSFSELTISIIDTIPIIDYDPSNLTLYLNTPHLNFPLIPNVIGAGEVDIWEIHPSLPAGIQFSSSNGTIWGVASEISPLQQYIIWANNSGGSSTSSINIVVLPYLDIQYPIIELILVQGQPMTPLSPSLSPDVPGDWIATPALPTGLFIEQNIGLVNGTPLNSQIRTEYLIEFSNQDYGSSQTILAITVLPDMDGDGQPDSGYDQGNFTFDDDDDGDGWNNTIEVECGSHPQNSSSVPKFSGGVCILKSEEDRGWPYIDDLCLPPFIAFLVLMALLLLYRNILLGLVWFTLSLIGLRKVPPPILIMEDE